jgi:hypothetical protein
METTKESANRILRSKAFLFLVVVLIILAAISFSIGGSPSEDGPTLKAVANASPEYARTGETIQFSAEGSKGNIHNFYWEFGDGYGDNGSEVSHAFEEGGYFNVTLFVENEKGKVVNDTVRVGIQPEDVLNTRDLDRDRDARPRWMHGFGLLGTVGPHISPPTSHLTYELVRAVGTFRIYVEVWIFHGDVYEVERLHTEEMTLTGEDLVFTYTVEPEDLPDLAATNRSMVHISSMIDQGRWASAHIEVVVEFPEVISEVKELE